MLELCPDVLELGNQRLANLGLARDENMLVVEHPLLRPVERAVDEVVVVDYGKLVVHAFITFVNSDLHRNKQGEHQAALHMSK